MKTIAVITTTRAEFGLLSPVIRELRNYENNGFHVDLIVSGTHLSPEYGMTIDEIQATGTRIDKQIAIPVNSKTDLDLSTNQADALVKFTRLFLAERYDAVILLGDRYETLAIAIAAGNTRTPVFHLCGGDTTEGALDEWMRHSITKISYLHFVTNVESKKRVIQLGEEPARVFNYGSTSIDNILTAANMSKQEALESIGLKECRYALCTYHPVTMENGTVEEKIHSFLEAIKQFPELQFVVTKSNADRGGAQINEMLDQAEKTIEHLHVFSSLGIKRYLSLMRHAEFVLGNSSSGIIETPTFHIPAVNIGDRQRGRLQSGSIVNCPDDTASIVEAIKTALSEEHKILCQSVVSPYGDGHAAEQIAAKCFETVTKNQIDLKKIFYLLDTTP